MSHPHDKTVFFLPESHFRVQVQARLETLRRRLEAAIQGADIQHVGSTAIPGSLTKGDLDVQIRVVAAEYCAAKERLCRLFDVNVGGFVADDATSFEDYRTEPPTGIHLTVIGGSADTQWLFRDRLIASEVLRREYDELKRQFEGSSMAKYREAKETFVDRVLRGNAIAPDRLGNGRA
jgi:GrpB-like predicted nucleotidyltransferase (UPF0157 family)